ncbi:hypothetical protein EVA_22480 [gut metagenome]|uniref:Uncharacterized protein n=1 Tax=gut metagenome TaxID=749906 RepID=J9F3E0_9ZZZZ
MHISQGFPVEEVLREAERVAAGQEVSNVLLTARREQENERIFEEQVRLFTYFFGTSGLTDEERWKFVEDYFTGTPDGELIR